MYEQYTVAPKSNHSSVHSMSRNISLSHEMIGFLETRKPCLEIGKLQIRGVGARDWARESRFSPKVSGFGQRLIWLRLRRRMSYHRYRPL